MTRSDAGPRMKTPLAATRCGISECQFDSPSKGIISPPFGKLYRWGKPRNESGPTGSSQQLPREDRVPPIPQLDRDRMNRILSAQRRFGADGVFQRNRHHAKLPPNMVNLTFSLLARGSWTIMGVCLPALAAAGSALAGVAGVAEGALGFTGRFRQGAVEG